MMISLSIARSARAALWNTADESRLSGAPCPAFLEQPLKSALEGTLEQRQRYTTQIAEIIRRDRA